MTVAPGDVMKVVQNYVWNGTETFANVYWYKHVSGGNVSDDGFKEDIASELDGALGFLVPVQSEDLVYAGFDVYNYTQDQPLGYEPQTTNVDGGSVEEALPPQVAGLVSFPTGIKRAVGRKFFPGFCEDNQVAGVWSQDVIDALIDFAAAILPGVTIEGAAFIPGHWAELAAEFLPWTLAVVDTITRSQRRRNYNVGS